MKFCLPGAVGKSGVPFNDAVLGTSVKNVLIRGKHFKQSPIRKQKKGFSALLLLTTFDDQS
ncbi:MAG: hypothetical protein HGB15_02170 [Chlorobaculum sp.]|nr:hypothetical protein [Chlorobaculum sp.]